jgi:hypothetical protein
VTVVRHCRYTPETATLSEAPAQVTLLSHPSLVIYRSRPDRHRRFGLFGSILGQHRPALRRLIALCHDLPI